GVDVVPENAATPKPGTTRPGGVDVVPENAATPKPGTTRPGGVDVVPENAATPKPGTTRPGGVDVVPENAATPKPGTPRPDLVPENTGTRPRGTTEPVVPESVPGAKPTTVRGNSEPLSPSGRPVEVVPANPVAPRLEVPPSTLRMDVHVKPAPELANLNAQLERLVPKATGGAKDELVHAQRQIAAFNAEPSTANYNQLRDSMRTLRHVPELQVDAALQAARQNVLARAVNETTQSIESLMKACNGGLGSVPSGLRADAEQLISKIKLHSDGMLTATTEAAQAKALSALKSDVAKLESLLGDAQALRSALSGLENAHAGLGQANYLARTGGTVGGRAIDAVTQTIDVLPRSAQLGIGGVAAIGLVDQLAEKFMPPKDEKKDAKAQTAAEAAAAGAAGAAAAGALAGAAAAGALAGAAVVAGAGAQPRVEAQAPAQKTPAENVEKQVVPNAQPQEQKDEDDVDNVEGNDAADNAAGLEDVEAVSAVSVNDAESVTADRLATPYLNSKEHSYKTSAQDNYEEKVRKRNRSMFGMDVEFMYQRFAGTPVVEDTAPVVQQFKPQFKISTIVQQEKTVNEQFNWTKTRLVTDRNGNISDSPYLSSHAGFRPSRIGKYGTAGSSDPYHANSLINKNYGFVVGPGMSMVNSGNSGTAPAGEATEQKNNDIAGGVATATLASANTSGAAAVVAQQNAQPQQAANAADPDGNGNNNSGNITLTNLV
ncbi:MAG: hypothetical protein K2W95_33490, partial [Candidatus Obscuribacterales bacterium]|nr:hypothetical protein [Candidatus Obscuribacterales bacterium]